MASATPRPVRPVSRRNLLGLVLTSTGALGLLAACGGTAATTATGSASTAAASASAAVTTAKPVSTTTSAPAATTASATSSAAATTAAAVTTSSAATSQATTSSAVAAASSAPAGPKVTLVFEWPQYTDEKTRYGEYIQSSYMKLHPNIQIEPMYNTDPTAKLTATIAAGSPPDVGWFGAGWPQLLQAFLPLDSFAQQQKVDPNNYFKKLWDSAHWQNKLYVMPNGFTCTLLYYNKDLLKTAGAKEPTETSTWDDLIQSGRQVVKPEQNIMGAALDMGSYYAELFYGGQFWNEDGTKATINNAVAIDLLQLYQDLDTKYKLVPTAAQVKGYGANTEEMFFKGGLAFFAGGAWAVEPVRTAAKFDWDITLLPVRSVSGKDYQATGMWTEEFFIEKDTKHQPEAWEFLQYVTGPELVSWAAQQGHIVPGRTDIAKSPTFLQANAKPANISAFFKAADLAWPASWHPEATKLSKALGDAVGLFLANPPKATAAEALQQANTQMQVILDQYNAGKK